MKSSYKNYSLNDRSIVFFGGRQNRCETGNPNKMKTDMNQEFENLKDSNSGLNPKIQNQGKNQMFS